MDFRDVWGLGDSVRVSAETCVVGFGVFTLSSPHSCFIIVIVDASSIGVLVIRLAHMFAPRFPLMGVE